MRQQYCLTQKFHCEKLTTNLDNVSELKVLEAVVYYLEVYLGPNLYIVLRALQEACVTQNQALHQS